MDTQTEPVTAAGGAVTEHMFSERRRLELTLMERTCGPAILQAVRHGGETAGAEVARKFERRFEALTPQPAEPEPAGWTPTPPPPNPTPAASDAEIGARVARLLTRRERSHQELADHLDINLFELRACLRGAPWPPLELAAAAEFLEVSVDDLMGGSD